MEDTDSQEIPKGRTSFVTPEAIELLERRAKRKLPSFESLEELNLVPYLDVSTNLVVFMLVSMATFIPLAMLSIFPPTVSSGSSSGTPPQEQLLLTVFITESGFTIAGSGDTLPPIPLTAQQEHDFPALATKIGEIKEKYPDETSAIIVADNSIRYELVVKTMDTLRVSEGKELFPDIQLSPGVAGRGAGP